MRQPEGTDLGRRGTDPERTGLADHTDLAGPAHTDLVDPGGLGCDCSIPSADRARSTVAAAGQGPGSSRFAGLLVGTARVLHCRWA
jgi:hypothetical protein